jgi:hypothetical protein
MAGSRVAVSGLLIGEGGVDGINVTTVTRVAPKCPWRSESDAAGNLADSHDGRRLGNCVGL